MITTAKQLPTLLGRVLSTGRVPMIHGSPGTGKSDIAKKLASENNLYLIDMRLSQMTPTSLNGFGRINVQSNKSEFIPFAEFPLVGDKVPEGYDGWLLFLDELPSAVPQVIAAAYKLILDRMIGSVKLHPDCYMIAAGNKATDGAIVNKTGTAMQSRMIHLELGTDKDAFIEWGSKNGIDFRLLAYINFKPSVITSFDPNHKDYTFTCPRTVEFGSDLIKDRPVLDHDDLTLLAGCLGEGNAMEFYGFCDIFQDLPTIKEIVKSPKDAKYINSPSFKCGISSFIAEHMTEKNIEPLLEYTKRLSPEFQAITARQAYRNNNALISNEFMVKWLDLISVYF
jgi:hypothetical protein